MLRSSKANKEGTYVAALIQYVGGLEQKLKEKQDLALKDKADSSTGSEQYSAKAEAAESTKPLAVQPAIPKPTDAGELSQGAKTVCKFKAGDVVTIVPKYIRRNGSSMPS